MQPDLFTRYLFPVTKWTRFQCERLYSTDGLISVPTTKVQVEFLAVLLTAAPKLRISLSVFVVFEIDRNL